MMSSKLRYRYATEHNDDNMILSTQERNTAFSPNRSPHKKDYYSTLSAVSVCCCCSATHTVRVLCGGKKEGAAYYCCSSAEQCCAQKSCIV